MRLRSAEWLGKRDRDGLTHRSGDFLPGFAHGATDGRPVIGVANSWSELTPGNAHLRQLAEAVKRGVSEAGGVPLEFPTMSAGEGVRPTSMLLRNLLAMEVEETLRANPLDGVVLLAGCDKAMPGQLMGAASADLPTAVVSGGPQPTGRRAGRAGTIGTASPMACVAEALGLQLPEGATLPVADLRRLALAQLTGRRIVAMVGEQLRPSRILTRPAFENAIRVLAALGGSTNAVVHLLAIAHRVGVELSLDDFDAWMRDVPTLVDVEPSGRFPTEEFAAAGGTQAVMWELRHLLHGDLPTVGGCTIAEGLREAETDDREAISPFHAPRQPAGSATTVLRGNLCPGGAVIRQSAASPDLLRHRGPALVFDRVEDYDAVRDDESLEVDERTVLVVRNAGPRGCPGMPEIGDLPLPRALLRRGVTDMVRITDGRMGGAADGTIVLHAAPEAAVGGPLALVRTGDVVALNVPVRRLEIELDDAELARRRAAWRPPAAPGRGYAQLYADHVLQADRGVDFDFLVGCRGDAVPRNPH